MLILSLTTLPLYMDQANYEKNCQQNIQIHETKILPNMMSKLNSASHALPLTQRPSSQEIL
jgi:hypothetical protein